MSNNALDPVDQWMIKSNLKRIAAGTPAEQVIATLRHNGYFKVAVEAEVHRK